MKLQFSTKVSILQSFTWNKYVHIRLQILRNIAMSKLSRGADTGVPSNNFIVHRMKNKFCSVTVRISVQHGSVYNTI